MKLLFFTVYEVSSPSCELACEYGRYSDPVCEEVDAYLLCPSRHPLTEDIAWRNLDSIFNKEVENPMNFGGLEETAEKVLEKGTCKRVVIYVTGLTPALIAAVNVAHTLDKDVTLMHYDREKGIYMPQRVYGLDESKYLYNKRKAKEGKANAEKKRHKTRNKDSSEMSL